MNKSIFLAGAAAILLALPAHAADLQDVCGALKITGCEHTEDTDTTKNDNGRVGQGASLAATSFAEVSTPGERLNLTMNWMTNDLGGPGSAGGGVLVNIRELDPNLYVGPYGGYNFEGQGGLVGLGVRWAISPF